MTAIVGINRVDQPLNHNVAIVFGPDGRVMLTYEKHHLVPMTSACQKHKSLQAHPRVFALTLILVG